VTDSPTADQVAALIVAACRETGASPIDVLSGEHDEYRNLSYELGYPISRARVYAAAAINEMFGCGRAVSSRLCGVGKNSQGAHLSLIYSGSAKWFDVATLRRVASVIDAERAAAIELDREYPRRRVPTSRDPECDYEVGERVHHPTYGFGRVVEIGAYNHRRRDHPLTIKFDGSEREQMMYACVLSTVTTPTVTVDHKPAEPARAPSPLRRAPMPGSSEFSGPLTLRKVAVPAHLCEDQTADLMGDPPPSRRSFSQNVAETYARIERETRAELRGDQ